VLILVNICFVLSIFLILFKSTEVDHKSHKRAKKYLIIIFHSPTADRREGYDPLGACCPNPNTTYIFPDYFLLLNKIDIISVEYNS